jgi:hypothetical protein
VKYAQYGITPFVTRRSSRTRPADETVPVQNMTDLNYINFLAARQGYRLLRRAGPRPEHELRILGAAAHPAALPRGAAAEGHHLQLGAGDERVVGELHLQRARADGRRGTSYRTAARTSRCPSSLRRKVYAHPAREPARVIFNQPNVRVSLLPSTPQQAKRNAGGGGGGGAAEEFPEARTTAGLEFAEAIIRAQATTDASTDNVVTVSGELRRVEYGEILRARAIVGCAAWATATAATTTSRASRTR